MSNFFQDNADLQYYLSKGLDWVSIVESTEFGYRAKDGFQNKEEAVEFYRDILNMVGEFAAEEIAPHTSQIDRETIRLVDGEVVLPKKLASIFQKINSLQMHSVCLPRELGGINAPTLLYFIIFEIFARADVSVTAHYGFHGGIAAALLIFSLLEGSTEIDPNTFTIKKTRFQKEIDEIISGKAWGCMDITEPNAGSDMAALRTFGEQDDTGNWYVTGEKIFITSGHGKYHFVIARTEKTKDTTDPLAGLDGLSMFLVKTYEEDASGNRKRLAKLERIEEKLGHHSSVTATLTFDRTPAQLIGKRGEGFSHMLLLMNNARLGVGFESLGLCESAYRLAKEYSSTRPSMGKPIDRHEMIADYLDEMKTDILAIRALAIFGAFHEEMSHKQKLRLLFAPPENEVDKKRMETGLKRHKRLSRRVTPLVKYMASEKAVKIARTCIQIHGGNGYMKEYGAEKLLRDAIVMPIYEGTSQIQALMAMKDTLSGIIKNPQAFVRRLAQARWRSLSAKSSLEGRVAKIQILSLSTQQFLLTKTATDKFRSLQGKPISDWPRAFLQDWNPKRDFSYAMLHAERLILLLSDEAICEVLLAQSQKHKERTEILERYLERAEPRSRFLHDEITSTGSHLIERLQKSDATSHEEDQATG